MTPSAYGSTHDKTIYDDVKIITGGVPLLMDLGFLGAEKDNTIILPFKKQKGGKLNAVQKQINQAISKLRVKIEHAFAGIKRLKIVRDTIRIRGYEKKQIVIKIAAALHNFRLTLRSHLQNDS